MERKLEYMFRRLLERLGDRAFTMILERIYNLVIMEREPALNIVQKLDSRPGRKSKVKKYLELGDTALTLSLLKDDFRNGLISRRTYFSAKRKIKQLT
ncbi:MAG: hypothetical protein HXX80_03095 [Nitrososphaerales archaeon]|nr:hypothetical protein [Nitrososphaerales archaeon]